jgi:hypothetical protein
VICSHYGDQHHLFLEEHDPHLFSFREWHTSWLWHEKQLSITVTAALIFRCRHLVKSVFWQDIFGLEHMDKDKYI